MCSRQAACTTLWVADGAAAAHVFDLMKFCEFGWKRARDLACDLVSQGRLPGRARQW